MHSKVSQFPQPAGVAIVGQPITVLSVYVPATATLTCNCGGDHGPIEIVNSTAAACPSCGNLYNAIFHPQSGIQITCQKPKVEVPS